MTNENGIKGMTTVPQTRGRFEGYIQFSVRMQCHADTFCMQCWPLSGCYLTQLGIQPRSAVTQISIK